MSSAGLPEQVVVEVTQDDIDRGIRSAGSCCANALAAERAGLPRPHVEIGYIIPADDLDDEHARSWEYGLPSAAAEFVMDFDEARFVEPFTFTAFRLWPAGSRGRRKS